MTQSKYISKSVVGGWQTQQVKDGKLIGPVFNSAPDLWKWQTAHLRKAEYIDTTWEVRTYDVWGNPKDGYEVNDTYRFKAGEVTIRCKVEVNNASTPQEFLSAYPSDSQIRRALSLRRFKIETDGDDLNIYVNRAKDSYPCGELYCTSHESLSPIRTKVSGI